MQTLKIFLILLNLVPLTVSAQDFATRVKAAYLKTDQNFDLDCNYSLNQSFKVITAVSKTVKNPNQLTRNFILETENRQVPMTFSLTKNQKSFEYAVSLDSTSVSRGLLSERDFNLNPTQNQRLNEELEVTKISCHVNFAYAAPVTLKDGNYHFNVHPHTIYDNQSRLKAQVENYLNDPRFTSLIFLDTGNFRGNLVNLNNFFSDIATRLPESRFQSDLVNVPLDIPLIVSPAGNNRFEMKAERELNITFTGGNHNYCIWNSTRQVLIALLNSKSQARVTFNYDMQAIVAQQTGMQGLSLSFSRGAIANSNLLKDLLSNKAIQANYHASYLIFFRNLFAKEYAGMYRTLKINYRAEGYNETFVVQGNGLKTLEVDFKYL